MQLIACSIRSAEVARHNFHQDVTAGESRRLIASPMPPKTSLAQTLTCNTALPISAYPFTAIGTPCFSLVTISVSCPLILSPLTT